MLELTAIDVGQGDSLLVVFPAARPCSSMAADVWSTAANENRISISAKTSSPPIYGAGAFAASTCIVATHSHQDHIGGLAAAMSNFRPKELWTGANPPGELLELAHRLGIPSSEKHPAGLVELSGATLEVLAPADDYAAEKAGNNDSLVLRITYGARSFLLTGDMERRIEAKLLASGTDLHADVLKVGHHGSRTSSTQAFLDAVSPSVALISAGYENSFGHPHPDVLGRLSARHTAVLRTDLNGLVTARTDGRSVFFDLQTWQDYPQPLRFPQHLIQ